MGDNNNTKKINEHIPCGFGVFSKFAYGEIPNALKVYRGRDCVEKFISYIQSEACRLYNLFPEKPMGKLTGEEWKEFNVAKGLSYMFEGF